jgi:hypothetical protein
MKNFLLKSNCLCFYGLKHEWTRLREPSLPQKNNGA